MKSIAEIDHNFRSEGRLKLDDVCFYNVKANDWCLFGLIYDEYFRRMPEDAASKVSEGVYELHNHTSGGRVRFSTDSPYVAICAVMPPRKVMSSHIPNTGVTGFDMYVGEDFVRTFIPPIEIIDGYEGVYHFPDTQNREIMIHFPLYSKVKDLYIGLKKGCSFKGCAPYKAPQKIVYYGSSITQGACVSRPGVAYPSQVSIKLNCDFINLGFSGSAMGEPAMAEYIAGLNPDIFVMDYDHNAPNLEFLEKTHEKFFKTFRNIKKNVPVVFMSAPDVRFHGEEWIKRRNIVYHTYENAVNSGDSDVYFVDGKELWDDEDWRMCSVDALHPNDLGHYRMAKNLVPIMQKILKDIN